MRYPANRPNLSPSCTYLGSAATRPHQDGAFAEDAVLPTRMLRVLPPGLSLRTAALIEPASVAWHAVGRAGDLKGARTLVIGIGSDILFPVAEQQVLATLIPGADFQVIQSLYGHDGFLLEFVQIGQLVKGFLQKHAEEEKRLYLA